MKAVRPKATAENQSILLYIYIYISVVSRPPSVSQDYAFAPGFIEQHLWWPKRPIFEWQSLSHLSQLKIVLGSITVPMSFRIFRFFTCRMFCVFSACLIPSFTRCCHVEWSSTISSQLSMSMAAEFISLLQTSLKQRSGQPVLRVPFSRLLRRRSFGILPFPIPAYVCDSAI